MESSVWIKAGSHKLSGVLHLPQSTGYSTFPVVVICHGFISSKVGQHQLFVKAAREFCAAGYAVLRFDFSGCGESTGEYRRVTLNGQIAETIRVLDFITEHPLLDTRQITLLGHSLGGCIAASVTGRDRRVANLVLWNPVARPLEDLVSIIGTDIYHDCLKHQQALYLGYELGIEYIRSWSLTHPLKKVRHFAKDVLIIQATNDQETPPENADLYYQVLQNRPWGAVTLKLIEGADHTFSSPVWEKQTFLSTIGWLNNRIKRQSFQGVV